MKIEESVKELYRNAYKLGVHETTLQAIAVYDTRADVEKHLSCGDRCELLCAGMPEFIRKQDIAYLSPVQKERLIALRGEFFTDQEDYTTASLVRMINYNPDIIKRVDIARFDAEDWLEMCREHRELISLVPDDLDRRWLLAEIDPVFLDDARGLTLRHFRNTDWAMILSVDPSWVDMCPRSVLSSMLISSWGKIVNRQPSLLPTFVLHSMYKPKVILPYLKPDFPEQFACHFNIVEASPSHEWADYMKAFPGLAKIVHMQRLKFTELLELLLVHPQLFKLVPVNMREAAQLWRITLDHPDLTDKLDWTTFNYLAPTSRKLFLLQRNPNALKHLQVSGRDKHWRGVVLANPDNDDITDSVDFTFFRTGTIREFHMISDHLSDKLTKRYRGPLPEQAEQ